MIATFKRNESSERPWCIDIRQDRLIVRHAQNAQTTSLSPTKISATFYIPSLKLSTNFECFNEARLCSLRPMRRLYLTHIYLQSCLKWNLVQLSILPTWSKLPSHPRVKEV
ncbi:hypothetical protein NPIL_516911 [Nephila pilipes]|uniref:Uncharacterized protein n=1 Tax=Nephila pilipes TaxID=299642 RepID=A0A8X6QQD7_NEPPI|nr:hypothetical protein NPIL_516911 [Nephila pilipes]